MEPSLQQFVQKFWRQILSNLVKSFDMTRVARWFIFKPKIPIWVKFGCPWNHLEYNTAIWYDLRPFGIVCSRFGIFFPFWYVWTEKNLAALDDMTLPCEMAQAFQF
jgi:hypothetical protein